MASSGCNFFSQSSFLSILSRLKLTTSNCDLILIFISTTCLFVCMFVCLYASSLNLLSSHEYSTIHSPVLHFPFYYLLHLSSRSYTTHLAVTTYVSSPMFTLKSGCCACVVVAERNSTELGYCSIRGHRIYLRVFDDIRFPAPPTCACVFGVFLLWCTGGTCATHFY